MAQKVTTIGGHSLDFVQRILDSLNLPPLIVAAKLGVPLGDVLAIQRGTRKRVIAVDEDELLTKLAGLVDTQIGALLSVRQELQRKLDQDRAERERQRARIANR